MVRDTEWGTVKSGRSSLRFRRMRDLRLAKLDEKKEEGEAGDNYD